jgi:epoxide hydrolase-like predicted phosphatase
MPILVLDIGGVVYRSWPDDEFHARWAEPCGRDAQALAEGLWRGEEWRSAMLGQIAEDACYAAAARRLGVDADLVRRMVADAFMSSPDERLAAYVRRLKDAGVIVAALTNNTATAEVLGGRLELSRLFDIIVSSADVGLTKPDAEIFRLAERRLGASAADLVLVDDVEVNVTTARDLGWQAVWFRDTEQAIGEIARLFAEAP